MRGCVSAGVVPALSEREGVIAAPADYIANSMTYLIFSSDEGYLPNTGSRVLQIDSEFMPFGVLTAPALQEFFLFQGITAPVVERSYSKWIERIIEDGEENPLFPLLPLLQHRSFLSSSSDPHIRATENWLESLSMATDQLDELRCPKLTDEYLLHCVKLFLTSSDV